jgi:hypothetical protein
MSNPSAASENAAELNEAKTVPWLMATIEDVQDFDFEGPIANSTAADSDELSELYRAAASQDQSTNTSKSSALRVYNLLAAVAGIYFAPENREEPFGPMAVLADGRRSPIPEDFRGSPQKVLSNLAERSKNPVLRARLSDVCWILDRKQANLGASAISSYLEIIRRLDNHQLKFRYDDEVGILAHDVEEYLRRSLQIGRAIGWSKPETIAARDLAADIRQRAIKSRSLVPVHRYCSLDLDFKISNPGEVATSIETMLKCRTKEDQARENDFHTVTDLWRLASRGYRIAKREEDASRCKVEAAEQLVSASERMQDSAMLASHHLSEAIAELHGISGQKDRRTELRHRLIDIQARIPEEMSTFSQEMDLRELLDRIQKNFESLSLLDSIFAFASIAESPKPEDLMREAVESIRKHPLSAIFDTTHHDREGKVIHRTEGGLSLGEANDSAIQNRIVQNESIRRNIVAAEIQTIRHSIVQQHYLSEDLFVGLLQHSPFVPRDVLGTFSRGFIRFFRGDFVSAIYILTPLLENSLRYVLKLYGHDVTKFDDATQTQQDRTISQLFEQMRSELNAIFSSSIVADIENVFLKKPRPYIRHALAHGLLHDSDPYGSDSIYGCWLIMRLCLLPLLPHRDRFKLPDDSTQAL